MDWNARQMKHYLELSEACGPRSTWDAAAACFKDCKLGQPASAGDLASFEAAVGRTLPSDLRELYSRTDGLYANYGAGLVMPVRVALQENERLRHSPLLRANYMPFDHMLVFGESGNGDCFFFPIRIDGTIAGHVFLWDHETDSRSFFANDLKDFFLRHATNLVD